MRVAYLGPEGTFTHQALIAAADRHDLELVASPTIYDAVMAVHDGSAERALVPIENSLEGSVNATLDTLAMAALGVRDLADDLRRSLDVRQDLAAQSRVLF